MKELEYDKFDSEYWDNQRDFSVLVGQTITSVNQTSNEITFYTDAGYEYLMHHEQSCCESVFIEDIVGDLQDLVGQEIVVAEERTSTEKQEWENKEPSEYYEDSFLWTIYTIGCFKTSVDIRWYGSSNGYYSESVSFKRIS